MKKTKIVATIGPVSEKEEILRQLFQKGVNVVRLNFAHGNRQEHKKRLDLIKRLRKEMDLPIGTMLDSKGPEIRLGSFNGEEIYLKEKDEFIITTRPIVGSQEIAHVTYDGLVRDIEIGDKILIDDGLVGLQVMEKLNETDILCEIQNGGYISDNKGINVPNVMINLPPITEKDIADIKFGIKEGMDFVAPSFIRNASNVLEIREILEKNNGEHMEIISKIENQEGLDNLEEIITVSDGIMVARGDLGVELTTEEIPLVQKMIIEKCNEAGKPVITATQMLDSMIRNPRPTRAEVTDVANAILDGTDAIMLSGETAIGKYPKESVETMYDIAMNIEKSRAYIEKIRLRNWNKEINTTNAISKATCTTAEDLEASVIITATSSGLTSKAVSKFRPRNMLVAATTSESVMRKLALTWGVYPVLCNESKNTDEVIERSILPTMQKGYVKEGDLVVITAGVPVGVSGTTNLIKVHTVGKVILKGVGIGKRSIAGRVCVGKKPGDFKGKFREGDILVAYSTDDDMIEYMQKASAIIVEQGGRTSHAAIQGGKFGKPVLVGAKKAVSLLKDKEIVTVDVDGGLVYQGQARV